MRLESTCWCGGLTTVVDPIGSAILVCSDSEFHDPLATGVPERIERLYVAGPMSGYPESNYPAFNEAARRLTDAGFEVLNPATSVVGTEAHYVDFLREDLRMMLECHGVALLEGWWESVGARNEAQVAGILKMPVRPVAEWLERAAQELRR